MPFTTDQFFDVFRRYNEAIWPAQIGLVILGLIAAFAAYRACQIRSSRLAQVAVVLLAPLWLWTGIIYHKTFFAVINPVAEVFGSIFIAQAGLLLLWALGAGPSFEPVSRAARVTGLSLIGYALILYPLAGIALGHRYPSAPSFGAPCPMTIFTFGVFCLLATSVPRFAMAIPVTWALIGSYGAFGFGIPEDAGLVVSAIATMLVIHHENHQAVHSLSSRAF
jgi:hypothetical protein